MKPTSSALLVSMLAPHIAAVTGQWLRTKDDTTAAGLARLMASESAGIEAALPGSLARILGVPVTAAAAATAATAVSSATAKAAGVKPAAGRKVVEPVYPATKIKQMAAVAPRTSSATDAAVSRPVRGGMGPWIIFPIGLLAGAGLAGIATGLRPALNAPGTPAAVALPTEAAVKPATPAVKPVSPAVAAAPPAKVDAPKGVEPPKVAAQPPAPAPAPKASKASKAPKAAEAKVEATPAVVSPPGTTSYFGITPPVATVAD